ncbi:MAG: hypothetical protein LAT65_19210 [Saccharospirillum sp.]|nr:hypothetical protein [Saccharospirillum sp.]
MLDIHITEFYNDMARILVTLYRQFPRQVSVYIEDISGPDTPDDYGLHSERHMACFSTVLWMEQEGLIRYGDIERQVAFNHCTLTLPTFRKLAGFDRELEGPPLIDELRLALSEGSSDMTEGALKRLLGGV